MNIIVHCPAITTFLLSQDASSDRHDNSYIHNLMEKGMNKLSVENVVQIVTDNISNNIFVRNIMTDNISNNIF